MMMFRVQNPVLIIWADTTSRLSKARLLKGRLLIRRLLWVDSVELIWVMILSTYGQQQREAIVEAEPGVLPFDAALAEQLVPQEMLVAAVPALPAVE